jgi:hypothetical protein
MPIQAQAFDGTVHEFPDGTPATAIDKAMKAYTQSAKPAAPSYAKMDLAGIQAEYQRARKAGADDKTLASIADAYVQKEQAERSTGLTGVVNAADNFVRDFARGVPIVGGALDEVNAGVSALTKRWTISGHGTDITTKPLGR